MDKRFRLWQVAGGYAIFDNGTHQWLMPDDCDVLPKMRARRIVERLESEPELVDIFAWHQPAVQA